VAERPNASQPADDARDGGTPGWREVLLLGFAVVAIVLGLAVLTSVLPVGFQDVIFRTPLAIVVLAVGTVGLLIWVLRRPTPRV
jgi:hypothetical protein